MKVHFLPRFSQQFFALPHNVQKKVDKQITFLLRDMRHPSLHTKKYDESEDVWQARVDDHYRFYFKIIGDTYEMMFVIPHPK